jgi:hypothetical protein
VYLYLFITLLAPPASLAPRQLTAPAPAPILESVPPPAPAVRNDAPRDLDEAFDLIALAVDAFKRKKYGVFTGILIMLAVFFFQRSRLGARLPKSAAPWLACGIAVAASIATVLIAGRPPLTALAHGVVLGAAASGFWELAGKHLLKS